MSFDLDSYIKETTEQWESEMTKHKRFPLWNKNEIPMFDPNIEQSEPSIVPYLVQGDWLRGAVIICAGGSYTWKEPLEAFAHAEWLNQAGFHAFVLDYRVKPYKPACALCDAQRAIRTLKYMANAWKIKKDHIALMGFSSGGHLAAMASTHFDYGNKLAKDPVDRKSCRPDAQILCYPHITYTPYIKDDPEFMVKTFGEGYAEEDVNKVNANLHVKEDTPPVFLWGMQGDWQFKQKHWKFYTEALDEKEISYSYHIFPNGSHSEAREPVSPVWKQWTMLCEFWLKDLGF